MKTLIVLGLLLFLTIGLLIAVLNLTVFKGGRYKGPLSDHFDGEHFFNPIPAPKKYSFFSFYRMRFQEKFATWPAWVETPSPYVPQERVLDGSAQITFVNHATVLIQMHGLNILTDPIWSDYASPFLGFGPKRVRNPGVRFEELPPIDAVLVSHEHYDHLDLPTLRRLNEKFHPQFYVGLGNKSFLEKRISEARVREMDWGQHLPIGNGLEVYFLPSQHWSARGPFQRNRALWGSFLLQSPEKKIFFAGDTGYSPHFRAMAQQFGAVDVALLPIGAYEPRWFMNYAHINPEEAVMAHRDLGSRFSIGIHFGTFQLTQEPIDAPELAVREAQQKYNISSKDFIVPQFGQSFKR